MDQRPLTQLMPVYSINIDNMLNIRITSAINSLDHRSDNRNLSNWIWLAKKTVDMIGFWVISLAYKGQQSIVYQKNSTAGIMSSALGGLRNHFIEEIRLKIIILIFRAFLFPLEISSMDNQRTTMESKENTLGLRQQTSLALGKNTAKTPIDWH